MAFLTSSPELSSVAACRPIGPAKPFDSWTKIVTVPNKRDRFGSMLMVCSGLKDCNVMIHGQSCAVVKPDSVKRKEEEDEKMKQDYYVNMGYAIRTLREEFPELFYRELNLLIYRDDIVFKDPMNTFVGIENYKTIFWALRFHGRIFFRVLWVDIVNIWQPVENVVMIRWTVHGIPRVPWESHGRFDGTSEYKLDKDGKIYEHRVDNIAISSPPKFRMLAVQELIQSLGHPSNAKPTYFEQSFSLVSFSDESCQVTNEEGA